MSASVFALLAAAIIGVGEFFAHFGLRRVKPLAGVWLATGYAIPALLVILALRGRWGVGAWEGVALFVLVGILHPGGYFFALFNAIQRIGPSRAITIRATSPLFAVVFAVGFLGERPTFPAYMGIVLIVGGVMFLTWGGEKVKAQRAGWWFGILASFFSGLAPVFTKGALRYWDDPILGVFFAIISGLICITAVNSFVERTSGEGLWVRTIPSRAYLLFLPTGILTGAAYSSWFFALSLGPVSTVIPIVQMSPLFAILMSRVFLQKEERVNARLVTSALVIICGAALITLGRA